MTDRLWELYPVFIDAGYTPILFWDSSMDEIIDMLESKARTETRRAELFDTDKKYDAILNSVLARQIMEYIACLLPSEGEKQVTPLYELYPHWFSEKKEMAEEKHKEYELALNQARMEDFMFRNNLRFKGGE